MAKLRKRLSAEQRRHLIVDKAVALFSERGFRTTRVKDIAEAVGTSDALVFQHFPTKRELYDAILEEMCTRRHFTDVEALLYYSPGYTLDEALTRLATWVLDETEREPAWIRLMLHAALEQDEALPDLVREHYQRIMDYIAWEIAERQMAGELRGTDAAAVARGFLATLLGLALMRTVVRDAGFRAQTARDEATTLVNTFLSGLKASPPPLSPQEPSLGRSHRH